MGETAESVAPESPVPGSHRRRWIALAVLGLLIGLAWKTMDPGKVRSVVVILLAAFVLRILLTGSSSR